MNKEAFLNELEQLLCDISKTEREEALQYYREYFEDANMPEEEVIKQLGSASSVANSIREELADKEVVPYTPKDNGENRNSGTEYQKAQDSDWKMQEEKTKDDKDTWLVILLVVVGIFCSPLIIGGCAALLGVLLAVIGVLLGIVLASAICVVAFGIAAVALLIGTVIKLFVSPVAAILLLGSCLVCTGLCFLSILITIKMCTYILPGFFVGLGKLIAMPFRKKQSGMA